MQPRELDKKTLDKIRELVEANFGGRDELYAAAESLDDQDAERVCRRLAEHLAGHATDLQHILAACGHEVTGPLDIDDIVAALFESIKQQQGAPGIFEVAEGKQRDLKRGYDRAIEETTTEDTKELLRGQRNQIEFAESVLRRMKHSESKTENG